MEASEDSRNIKINRQASIVTYAHNFEDVELTVLLKIPVCYPLLPVEVTSDGGRLAGVKQERWRSWMLGVSTCIGQTASLITAIQLFKRNITLHFEGIEDCAICYSVIEVTDRTLPTKSCRVCRNKFHATCLYKWFKSSSQNTCPLCRQAF